jgi:hypothetical protein
MVHEKTPGGIPCRRNQVFPAFQAIEPADRGGHLIGEFVPDSGGDVGLKDVLQPACLGD